MRTNNSDRHAHQSRGVQVWKSLFPGARTVMMQPYGANTHFLCTIYSVNRLTKIRVSGLTILRSYHQLAAMHHNEHSHSPSHATRTRPSWGTMACLEPGCQVAGFSTSGTEEVSLSFGEPDLSYTDPSILPAPYFQPAGTGQNLKMPIPLLSAAAAPGTKSSSTDASHASEPPLLLHTSRARGGGTVLEHLVRVIAAMQNDKKNGGERKVSVFNLCITSQHLRDHDIMRKSKLIDWVAKL
jgi:hypothetical protein